MENYTLSDLAAATNHGGFGGAGWGGVLAGGLGGLLLGGALNGNGLFGNGRGQAATTEDLASGFNFAGINGKLNELTAGQAGINQNLGNAICQLGYNALEQNAGLGSKIDACCCATQRAVDSVKFDMANYAAATNATVTASMQKVLDKMCENEKAAMAARIQQLEMQIALCGVVRYPTSTSYAVPNPCFAGCGNGAY